MDLGLTGRAALVTGATSGIGLGVARALSGEGARVVLCGRRGEVAEAEAAALDGAHGVAADLTDPAALDELLRRTDELVGTLDVLVLNGGGPPPGGAADATPEQIAESMTSLLTQHVRLVRAVLPGMRERGWGRIVAVGSSGVQAPLPNLALSNVGRGALAGYLKTLAREVAADGVTVNMVLPGRIDTDRVAQLDRNAAERTGGTPQEARAASEAGIPARRYGTVDEYAAVATFLCGTGASYVTGEQVRCDGGLVASY